MADAEVVEAEGRRPRADDRARRRALHRCACAACASTTSSPRERSLRTDDRGAHAIIATATGEPYVSDFSGNVTELCPVGALTSKTYRFKSRPWDNHRTTTTCMQCSVGCQMHVDERVGAVLRTMSVDRRRRDLRRLAVRPRPLQHRLRHRRAPPHPAAATAQTASGCRSAGTTRSRCGPARCATAIATSGAASVGAIGGGRLLNEEAFLLQHVYRALGVENLDWRSGRQRRAYPGDDRRHARRSRERARASSRSDARPRNSRRCSTCAFAKPSRTRARR